MNGYFFIYIASDNCMLCMYCNLLNSGPCCINSHCFNILANVTPLQVNITGQLFFHAGGIASKTESLTYLPLLTERVYTLTLIYIFRLFLILKVIGIYIPISHICKCLFPTSSKAQYIFTQIRTNVFFSYDF